MKDLLKKNTILDLNDPLKKFRDKFHIPNKEGKEVVYFCGNSLGLQAKTTADYINDELTKWAQLGVDGHFSSQKPWLDYHRLLTSGLAALTGAKDKEVVAMNSLTVNLHLLLVSFYKPTSKKFKILIEANTFPSDRYALNSQVRFHGYDPEKAIVEISPRESENTIRTGDLIDLIEDHKETLALVMLGGVNYYTGQLFDIEKIAKKTNEIKCTIGLDLAHAIGNVPLKLHDWGVDFATWCSYKYLNSGPGGVSGIFIHDKHFNDPSIPRFEGWWGHDESLRFKMDKEFVPAPGAEAWQLSNAPILSMAGLNASLDIFKEAGTGKLRAKSILMSKLLFEGIAMFPQLKIITPSNPEERGCQISILMDKDGKKFFEYLLSNHIVVDWREPNVIRLAPVPLYNTFADINIFLNVLYDFFKQTKS